jgi:hypothetical protein
VIRFNSISRFQRAKSLVRSPGPCALQQSPAVKKDCHSQDTDRCAKAAAAPRPRRPRTRAEQPAVGKHTSSTLSDQVLALANGKTQQEIAAACKGARPNHVGAAIARYKWAGRIEERDGKLYAT